jgi:hypothetical protein
VTKRANGAVLREKRGLNKKMKNESADELGKVYNLMEWFNSKEAE